MITLLTFPASFNCPSHSPYCVKAMCLLQMAGEAWQPEYHDDPRKMPYGKLPVARIEGVTVPDSSNIQRALEARGAAFFEGLSSREKAQAHAVQRMAEESLSFGLIHARWMLDDNWMIVRDVFFASIPRAIRGFVTNRLRNSLRNGLMAHGFGRLSDADRRKVLEADLAAIETLLADGPFLFGSLPTAADASVLPLVDMMASLPADGWLRQRIRSSDLLMGYVESGREAIYPPAHHEQACSEVKRGTLKAACT